MKVRLPHTKTELPLSSMSRPTLWRTTLITAVLPDGVAWHNLIGKALTFGLSASNR